MLQGHDQVLGLFVSEKYYPHHLTVEQVFQLEIVGTVLKDAFGWGTYLVGSVLHKKDFRDVDLRCIMSDDDYDKLIGGNELRLKLLNQMVTWWAMHMTRLPIDFQFQRQTQANEQYPKQPRNALGVQYYTWTHDQDGKELTP